MIRTYYYDHLSLETHIEIKKMHVSRREFTWNRNNK